MTLVEFIAECVAEYFRDDKTSTASDEDCSKKMQGYRCVLNSKATEESMVICWLKINLFQVRDIRVYFVLAKT